MTRILATDILTHLVKKDLLIETKGVAIKEGRVANKHFIEKDPQSPPIHCLVVTPRLKKWKILGNTCFWIFNLDNFRRKVFWGATQRPRPVCYTLGKPLFQNHYCA